MKPLLATFILSFFLLPLVTFAQYAPPVGTDGTISQGLVPCEGSFCSTCHVVVLANTGIKWLLTLSFLFFAILALRAGWKLIISQGNPSALTDAKQSFTNAFIGLALILTAWILVDTLMRNLIGNGGVIKNYGPWAQVQCTEQTTVSQAVEPYFEADEAFVPSAVVSGGTTATPVAAGQMVSLRSLGVNVANWDGTNAPGRTDKAHPMVANAVLRMQNAGKQKFGKLPFQVTAAYTENVGHSKNSKHYEGIAVDIQPINGVTKAQIVELARQAGFSYVLPEERHVHVDMR